MGGTSAYERMEPYIIAAVSMKILNRIGFKVRSSQHNFDSFQAHAYRLPSPDGVLMICICTADHRICGYVEYSLHTCPCLAANEPAASVERLRPSRNDRLVIRRRACDSMRTTLGRKLEERDRLRIEEDREEVHRERSRSRSPMELGGEFASSRDERGQVVFFSPRRRKAIHRACVISVPFR